MKKSAKSIKLAKSEYLFHLQEATEFFCYLAETYNNKENSSFRFCCGNVLFKEIVQSNYNLGFMERERKRMKRIKKPDATFLCKNLVHRDEA